MGFIKKQRKKLEEKAKDRIAEQIPTLKLQRDTFKRLNEAYPEINWNEEDIKTDIKNGILTEDSADEYFKELGKDVTVLRAINEQVKDPTINTQLQNFRTNKKVNYDNYQEILNDIPQFEKNLLLELGEMVIFVPRMTEQTKTTMQSRPKGITDVIGGAYGQTSITRTTDVNTVSSQTTEWKPDVLLLNDDGFTIMNTGETILFDHIESINVNEKTQTHMGSIVSVTLQNSYNFAFRTPITLGIETLIKEKIDNRKNSLESETNNTENSSSDADELMKYAELYEKGLLSEEEFNAKKKELLGL